MKPSIAPGTAEVCPWNVVASVRGGEFPNGISLLGRFGAAFRTGFYNVLVAKVADPRAFVEDLRREMARRPEEAASLHRVSPLTRTFGFRTPTEFREKAAAIACEWAGRVEGKRFGVNLRRRGFKGLLRAPDEERHLRSVLVEATEKVGRPAKPAFGNPEVIVLVETVGNQAGMALWTRGELERYTFLGWSEVGKRKSEVERMVS